MKRIIAWMLAVLMLVGCLSLGAFAAGTAVTFDLTCDGKNEVTAERNDIIEVTFAIRRTDADEKYYINALQNYIVYDEDFFRFVDGSASCTRTSTGFAGLVEAIGCNKIYMTDMMDTLPASLVFGTFRMQVIGTSGSGTIRNAEVKAYQKGSVPIDISCSDLTVTIGTPVPEEYTVTYDAGEGTVTPVSETVTEGNSVTLPSASRPYYDLTGWSDGVKDYAPGTAYTPDKSITLTAVWAEKPLRAAPAVGTRSASGENVSDGALLGTTAAMEYSSDGQTWLPCSDGETAGLIAGSYQVRYAGTETEKPGNAAAVEIEAEEEELTIPVTGDTTGIQMGVTIVDGIAILEDDPLLLERVIGERIVTGDVVIDLSVLAEDIIGVEIPERLLKAISDAANSKTNDTTGLTLRMKVGDLSLDAAALQAILGQGSGDCRIVIEPEGLSTLNDAQRAALEGRGILGIYDIYVVVNGERVSDLGGGHASIVIRHVLQAGQEPENLSVLFVAPEGILNRLGYTVEDGKICFIVNHFSIYAIVTDPSSETGCLRDETCPISPFTDTDRNLWWHDGIHFCVENGLMIGLDEDTFAPNMTIDRAMAVTVLWRIAGRPAVSANEKPYDDVDTGCWYTEPICWAKSAGVVQGYGNGMFGPVDSLTREQLAVILYRYAAPGDTVSVALPFSDAASVHSWAKDAVSWCYARGIVMGRDDGTFDPRGTATRAEAAAMIQRFCRLAA